MRHAQGFKVSKDSKLKELEFYAARGNLSTSNNEFQIKIHEDDSGDFGNLLGTTSFVAEDIINQEGNFNWYKASYFNDIHLVAENQYWLLFDFENVVSDADSVWLRVDYDGTYPQGIARRYCIGLGQWEDRPEWDILFKLRTVPDDVEVNSEVISKRYALNIVPKNAIVMANETPNNGSISYLVSRDDGATWTPATLNEYVHFTGPEGTNLRWKAIIEDNAELDAIAVGY